MRNAGEDGANLVYRHFIHNFRNVETHGVCLAKVHPRPQVSSTEKFGPSFWIMAIFWQNFRHNTRLILSHLMITFHVKH